MSEFVDALEGAVGLIAGGIILLLFTSALGQAGPIDLSTWGIVCIVVGVVVFIALVIAAITELIGGSR
ncbi:hypothetical protein [Natronosalvus rutilus]|uniref:Uncharacterized protein n=1 Tax=Natronosalvus rutilus TaxID=2953753 RepID=A0A9E7NCN5_9EURY|nr:hypothetical protein [Natronosalvus rutilus]UTF55832.1 hypothetical protein NGM29_20325 [Natronosalvus rutilus]